MILLIDNYDSFVYNLARYVCELGFSTQVIRNDKTNIQQIQTEYKPTHIIISPGPCDPNTAGISLEVIEKLGSSIPILGVCLGHQAIAQVFGANVVRAKKPMHAKQSMITHTGVGIFAELANPLAVARYHSLIVSDDNFPACLEVLARSEDDQQIMALRHRTQPLWGVQFHPESIITEQGYLLLTNFLRVN